MKIRITALLCAAVFVLSAPAFAGKRDNSIRFAYDQVPENVDPYFNNVRIGVIIAQHVWDTLIYRDPNTNEYKGQLATAWRWVDDKTLDLDLRQGVKFHNGDAFGADDVVYTLNYVSNPANKSTTQQNVNWIEKAEKLDAFKVRIKLKRTFPAAIEYLAGPLAIHPHAYYERVGPQGMNEKPIGTGPYRAVEHAQGKHLRLERNPDYFKDSPKPQPTIQRLEIRFIPDRQTQVAETLSGGIDFIMNVPPDQAAQMRAMPNLAVVSGETMRIVFLQMASTEKTPTPVLRDAKVRQAINHAIDRAAIVKNLVGEGARVLNTICFPSQFGCTDEGAPVYAYDPAKARQLLTEAGHPNGFEIDFYSYRDRPQAEAMIGYLRAVGIRANLRFLQYAAFREQLRADKVGLAHQTWGSFSVNDVSANTPVFYKFEDDDVTRDPQVRDLLDKGDGSVEPAARKDAYKQALARIAAQAYAVPLYSLTTFYVAPAELSFKAYPDELPRFWEARWK